VDGRTAGVNETRDHTVDSKGWTILELAATVGVIAVLAAALVPVFSSVIGTSSLHNESKELVMSLQWIRTAAVTEHDQYSILLDENNDRYLIRNDTDNCYIMPETFLPTPNQIYHVIEVDLTGISASTVSFYPDGSASSALHATLQDKTGSVLVMVSPATGVARLELGS
jgi:type II secretory pathway pseudopilin PulG